MLRFLVHPVIATVIAAGVVTATAATAGATSAAPAPPVSGTWTLTGDISGTMTVTAGHQDVTKLHGKFTSSAETPCGTGTIAVLSKLKIFQAKGTSAYGSYDEWAVGHNNPDADPVIQPILVSITRNGHERKAEIEIAWAGPRGPGKGADSGGEITYNAGNCDLQFDVHKS